MTLSLGTSLRIGSGPRPAWSPFRLGDDLLAYWDAAKGVTVTGAGASSWVDQKNGRTVTQSVDGSRPPWSATSFNDSPGLSFNGTSQRLTASSVWFPTGADPVEIWAVIQQDTLPADSNSRRIFCYGGTTNNNTRDVHRVGSTGINIARGNVGLGGSQLLVNGPTTIDFSSRRVVRARYDGAYLTVSVDGVEGTPTAAVPATGATNTSIGAHTGGVGYFGGLIRAIGVCNLLTPARRDDMWEHMLKLADKGADGVQRHHWTNGDSYGILNGGDGLAKRLLADGRISVQAAIGGSTLAEAVARVLATPWSRKGVLIFWDGNSNGYGTLSEDMAGYQAVANYVPRSLIIPPVRRGIDSSDMRAAISERQAAIAAAFPGRTLDMQALLAAAATSPGDDADVAANVVPSSLLIDPLNDAHLNTAGWNVAYPAITGLLTANGW